ncbi:MAG: exodeoxyribonuclease VII large subunit [Chloroflexota bacterium]
MDQVWSVSALTRYIRELFDIDYRLQDVWLAGEVSNFSRATSGHVYFTLKDDSAQIRCVMWRSTVARQGYLPAHGDAVLAHGSVSVYEANGAYQLYVDALRPLGRGDLHLEFERLKTRLAAEGLFDLERKRPIPPYPRRLGLITSPNAAALRDVLNILSRRYPLVEIVFAPAAVQGAEAPPQLCAALEALNRLEGLDAILLARGGGSLEELWAFNDETVARAIAASRYPVITGIGHETDFTIADFVADLRAPTPSAAAELAVPDRQDLKAQVEALGQRLVLALQGQIEAQRWRLQAQAQALRHLSPLGRLLNLRQRLDDLNERAIRLIQHTIALRRERLRGATLALAGLSPLATLERGYAVVRHLGRDEIVRDAAQVAPGDRLEVQVRRGRFTVRAETDGTGAGT